MTPAIAYGPSHRHFSNTMSHFIACASKHCRPRSMTGSGLCISTWRTLPSCGTPTWNVPVVRLLFSTYSRNTSLTFRSCSSPLTPGRYEHIATLGAALTPPKHTKGLHANVTHTAYHQPLPAPINSDASFARASPPPLTPCNKLSPVLPDNAVAATGGCHRLDLAGTASLTAPIGTFNNACTIRRKHLSTRLRWTRFDAVAAASTWTSSDVLPAHQRAYDIALGVP